MAFHRQRWFFQNHLTSIPPPKDEPDCVICRLPYLSEENPEECVRITGVPGCTHIFGKQCLWTMVTLNLAMGSQCPFCRTPWFNLGDPRIAGRLEVRANDPESMIAVIRRMMDVTRREIARREARTAELEGRIIELRRQIRTNEERIEKRIERNNCEIQKNQEQLQWHEVEIRSIQIQALAARLFRIVAVSLGVYSIVIILWYGWRFHRRAPIDLEVLLSLIAIGVISGEILAILGALSGQNDRRRN